jgi:hypothetical protein
MDETDNWRQSKAFGPNSDYQEFFIDTITRGVNSD